MAENGSGILSEITNNPLNIILVGVITFLLFKIFRRSTQANVQPVVESVTLPKLKKRDFTLEELKPYDGTGPEGRILLAINGKVFDVTRGKRFYGPGSVYSPFAGKDATRGFAKFIVAGNENYDDLSDLTSDEMNSVREWELQFTEQYDYVGKLLKPGEPHTNYSDEE